MSADLSASHINTSWGGCLVKGVQRDFPLAGVWGCPPALKKSPKIGGYRGLIETMSINLLVRILPKCEKQVSFLIGGKTLNGLLSSARANNEDKPMSVEGVIRNDGGHMSPIVLAVRKA